MLARICTRAAVANLLALMDHQGSSDHQLVTAELEDVTFHPSPGLPTYPFVPLLLTLLPTAADKGKGKAKKGSSFQTVSAVHRVSV